MAAYCVIRGIDYIVEEMPMAEGNRHLVYKEALKHAGAEVARRQGQNFLHLSFLERGHERFAGRRRDGAGRAHPLHGVRVAHHRRGVRLRRMSERVRARARREPPRSRTSQAVPARRAGAARRLQARRYMITLAEGGSFSTHAGTVPHADLNRP